MAITASARHKCRNKTISFADKAAVLLYADRSAPVPGVAGEAWISDADLAAEIKRLKVQPPQNGSFTAYHVTDVGADSAVPLTSCGCTTPSHRAYGAE